MGVPFHFDSFNQSHQNELDTEAFPTGQAQAPNDTELRDFSDDMDLDALGALLGADAPFGGDPFGGEPSWQSPESEPNPPGDDTKKEKKKKEKKKSGSLLAGLAAKFGGSKKKQKKDDNPLSEGEDIGGFDFTYQPYTEEDITGAQAADGDKALPLEQPSPFGEQLSFEPSSPFEAELLHNDVPPQDNAPLDFTDNGEAPLLFDDTSELPLSEETEPPVRRCQRKKGLADKLNDLVDTLSEKFGGKQKERNVSLYADTPPEDPNYVSENVRLVDIEEITRQPVEPSEEQPALFRNLPGEDTTEFLPSFGTPTEPTFSPPSAFDAKAAENSVGPSPFDNQLGQNAAPVSPFDNQLGQNAAPMPPFGNQLEQNAAPMPPLWDNSMQSIPFGGTVEGEPDLPPQDEALTEDGQAPEAPEETASETTEASGNDAPQEPPADKTGKERTYDIMGAVRARLRQLGKRLPSFKPKVYTIPESTYEPIDDNIKSPSLMADVEEYLRRRNFLGVVEMEYDEMRRYLDSVDTEVRLSPEDIRTPVNAQEVRDAENELLNLINEISAQNEQQRRQIGVYAPPPVEDPYNYRGINDERQFYTDIESASFSMQPRVSFESVQKIDPNRAAKEEAYYHRLHEMEEQRKTFGEELEDDFDDEWGSGGNAPDSRYASDTPPRRSRYDDLEDDFDDFGGRSAVRSRSRRGYDDGFDDDFDDFSDDFEDDFDDRRAVRRDTPRRRRRRSSEEVRSGSRANRDRDSRFDEELAEDFDRHFTVPRVAPRSEERKPKRVAVRRRGE